MGCRFRRDTYFNFLIRELRGFWNFNNAIFLDYSFQPVRFHRAGPVSSPCRENDSSKASWIMIAKSTLRSRQRQHIAMLAARRCGAMGECNAKHVAPCRVRDMAVQRKAA